MLRLIPRRFPSLAAAIIAGIGLILIAGQSAYAGPTVYEVTITGDRNSEPCTESCSLREAIIAANADPGPGLIVLEEDTYELSVPGFGEDASMTGDLDINDDLTIQAENGAEVIIDGDGNDGVFDVDDGVSFTLRNVIVQGGGNPASTEAMTGGIRSFGSLTLEGVTVRDNFVAGPSSVAGVASNGTLTMRDTTIMSNSVVMGEFGIGGLYSGGPMTIEDSAIVDNRAFGASGVGGAVLEDAEAELTNVEVVDNYAEGTRTAGGMYMENMPATFNEVTIAGNEANGAVVGGEDVVGGIWAYLVQLEITDSIIADNLAQGDFNTGGFYVYGSVVDIQESAIEDNTGEGDGSIGGFMMDGDFLLGRASERQFRTHGSNVGAAGEQLAPGDLTMSNTDITGNEADGEFAAGGVVLVGTDAEIDHVTIAANSGEGNEAQGGLYSEANLDMSDSAIVDNDALGQFAGGGVYIWALDTTLSRVLISGNDASGSPSTGGIGVDGPELVRTGLAQPTFQMFDSTVSGNTGSGEEAIGGLGVFAGVAQIERTTVSGNTTTGGSFTVAGIVNTAFTTLLNTTVSGNTAGVDGVGGVYNEGSLSIRNSTIAFNTSPGPDNGTGGLFVNADTLVGNTVFFGNTWDGTPENCWLEDGDIVSTGGNVEEIDSCALNDASDQPNANPMLGPLSHNGGFLETHALLNGSDAIDAAVDCPPPNEDARGAPRPGGIQRVGAQGAACDSGAYETDSTPPTPTPSPTPEPTPTPKVEYTQGDVDCDDDVDSVDSLKVLRHIASLSVAQTEPCPDIGTEVASLMGDVDCDNDVDSVDSLKVLRHIASLSVTQTEPCPDIGGSLARR